VGQWLREAGCDVSPAARGDWEVTLSPDLAQRWRRRRVRLVFDPQRPTLPRGSWFCAPGSPGGQKLIEVARARPVVARRTALPRIPGAPSEGFGAVCRVRGLRWSEPRLGPVRYHPRIAFHLAVTLWGGLPRHEQWTVVVNPAGELLEAVEGPELPEVRARDGVPPDFVGVDPTLRPESWSSARRHLEAMLERREGEWELELGRRRESELKRLRGFFATRLLEEEDRSRRRQTEPEEGGPNGADVRSLKLEWERRSAEVRARWAVRLEGRLWGVTEWAWPEAELEQELRFGAVHVKLSGTVDVARARPQAPRCPGCGRAAEMLLRGHGGVGCLQCAT
jgi:hypothetical protein